MNNLREPSKQFDFRTQLSNQGVSFNSFIMGSGKCWNPELLKVPFSKYLASTLVRV